MPYLKTLNKLHDIPSDTWCLVDTNILIYWALDHPEFGEECTNFITRGIKQEITLFIPAIVLNEFIHRLMIAEIMEHDSSINRIKALNILKNQKIEEKFFSRTWELVDTILSVHLHLLDYSENVIKNQVQILRKYPLMAADASVIASGIENDIHHIATRDSDFSIVPDFTIWSP
ncbi:type II toxin-antitoxin system VapC family toxin [Methanospirillum sp.]